VLAGCGGGDDSAVPPDPDAEFDTVTMGYLPMISSLTYFVAVDQGYFMDEGLEVDSIPITTSNDIASSLFAGDIAIGVELSVVPLLRQAQGLQQAPFLIFSTSRIEAEGGFDSILVMADSPYQSLEDLSGKAIAVFPGTTAQNTVLEVFASRYGDLEPPKPDPMLPSGHLAALESGDVSALHAYEPFLTIGLKQRNMRRIETSLYAEQMHPDPNPIGVAAVNRDWAEANPEVAAKAIRALDRAAEFIDKYPVKARLIASEYTGIDAQIVSDMNVMPMSKSASVDVAGLDKYFEILVRMGEVPEVPPASDIVYNP
jgi:NitT/TauT family transport system substrate-binding protein